MGRFMRKGITRWYFVPSIASGSLVPTAAEVNAGTRVDGQLAEVNGFSFQNNPIMVPDMSTTYTSQIGGEDSSDDSSMVFYEDQTSNPIRTALAKGTAGFMVIFKSGVAGASPAAGDKADVWPTTITSNAAQYTADNEAAKYMVSMAITARPVADITVT
jgi:hypothetical protein